MIKSDRIDIAFNSILLNFAVGPYSMYKKQICDKYHSPRLKYASYRLGVKTKKICNDKI